MRCNPLQCYTIANSDKHHATLSTNIKYLEPAELQADEKKKHGIETSVYGARRHFVCEGLCFEIGMKRFYRLPLKNNPPFSTPPPVLSPGLR